MTEEKYTRCPSCKTVFRVTDAQLALRDGMVRCGHCQTIFDGRAAQISLAPRPVADDAAMDEAMLGPPTVTLRSSRALEPLPPVEHPSQIEPRLHDEGVAGAESAGPATHTVAPDRGDRDGARDAADARDTAQDDVDFEPRFAWDRPARRRHGKCGGDRDRRRQRDGDERPAAPPGCELQREARRLRPLDVERPQLTLEIHSPPAASRAPARSAT